MSSFLISVFKGETFVKSSFVEYDKNDEAQLLSIHDSILDDLRINGAVVLQVSSKIVVQLRFDANMISIRVIDYSDVSISQANSRAVLDKDGVPRTPLYEGNPLMALLQVLPRVDV